jgi:hypothetical protein
MDIPTFWQIIETAKTKAKGNEGRMLATLAAALKDQGPAAVAAFQRHLDERMQAAYTWPLWGAAYILNGGCSDDGFEYFRGLLIANGREVFESAVKNPDSLAATKLKFGQAGDRGFESFLYVPAQVHEELMNGAKVPRTVERRAEHAGTGWAEGGDDLPALLPLLAKKYDW